MMVQARPGDESRLDAFLRLYADTSMFLRSNLAAHGLGPSDHQHATVFYLWQESGEIRAVFGATRGGFLMCQAPDAPGTIFDAFVESLRGYDFAGVTGENTQVCQLLTALEARQSSWDGPLPEFAMNQEERFCALNIDDLDGETPFDIRKATAGDLSFLVDWHMNYVKDAGLHDVMPTREQALDHMTRDINTGVWVLMMNGEPCAMTSLNACLPEIVQIGGVYVLPQFRGRGLAGQVVRAQLRDVRRKGVKRAVLVAVNEAAFRAYQRIGFRQIGTFRVAICAQPLRLGGMV